MSGVTQVNPLVVASLDGPATYVPRQGRGCCMLGDDATAGISAFAFQGTNAHAVIGEGPSRCKTLSWTLLV